MIYGSRELRRGDKGEDVVELQIRLSGFGGGVPDGDFGPGTEKSVAQFRRDYMVLEEKNEIVVTRLTFEAIDKFADEFPINFEALKCPCSTDPQFKGWENTCDGWGKGQFKNVYREGKPKIEAYHKYEYPGIHRCILWTSRAVNFYFPEYKLTYNCGYRCDERNKQKGRYSTNHCGKALDTDVPRTQSEDRNDDAKRCDEIRTKMVKKCGCQIGWTLLNKKSLEPSNIAPTWVHQDVRCFSPEYLTDNFFCKTLEELDNRLPITLGEDDDTKIISDEEKKTL